MGEPRHRADEEGLWIDGRLAVPRAAFGQALVLSEGERTWVRLQHARGVEEVDVADPAEGERLLAALRLDPMHKRLALEMVPVQGWPVAVAVLAGGLFELVDRALLETGHGDWGFWIVAMLVGGLAMWALHTRVVIGADGVRVERRVGPTRFVPYEAIRAVELHDDEIVLRHTAGSPVRLRVAERSHGAPTKEGKRAALGAYRAIHAAREALRAPRSDEVPTAALARNARPTTDWLRWLRGVGSGQAEADFRSAAVRREALWNALEGGRSSHAEQIGAAIALASADLDASERPRLRVVVERTADERHRERLRVATTSTDEELLARALEEAEEGDGAAATAG